MGDAFLQVSALGVVVAIEAADDVAADTISRARAAWARAEVRDAQAQVSVQLGGGDAAGALERLSVDVTLAALGQRSGELLMFHAAGLADADGRVIALVGPSGRGKTTLSRTLGEQLAYISDETVGVDDQRRVYPYRKPLSVVREGLPKEQVAVVEDGGAVVADAALTLSALVLLDRVEAATEPSVEPVPLVDALPDLIPQMSYLAELDRPLQRLSALIDAFGGVRRLVYAEAASVAPTVERLLSGSVPLARSEWRRATEAPLPENVVDAIVTDDALVVLADSTVRVLGGIAPEIWLRAVEGAAREEIVTAVIDRYGEPPTGDAAGLVDAALAELESARVISATRAA